MAQIVAFRMSQGRVKRLKILLKKNLIEQGTLSLERRDAVEDRRDGVFNCQDSLCVEE